MNTRIYPKELYEKYARELNEKIREQLKMKHRIGLIKKLLNK